MRGTPDERFWAKVEKSDGCWEWTAFKNEQGYGTFFYDGVTRWVHRVSFAMKYGPIPAGMLIDHICHNASCVNPDHLRMATHKQNQENRRGAMSNSKSGIRGVNWSKRESKWRAVMSHNNRYVHVGYFGTSEEAEAAVIAKRLELFTHNEIDRAA